MRILILIFIPFLILTSCKKDKLEGESSILIGEWEWEYSVEAVVTPWGIFRDTLYSSEYEDSRQIEFLSKGKIQFKTNNSIVEEKRIVFNLFQKSITDSMENSFSIYLNNKKDLEFRGEFNDTLMKCSSYNMPFYSGIENGYQVNYTNYFQRIK